MTFEQRRMELYLRHTLARLRDWRIGYAVAWLIFALAIVSVYCGASLGVVRSLFYNSDYLYLPALFQALAKTGSLSGWQVTRAPFFFPDIFAYFVLNLLLGNYHLALILYGVIQTFLFIVALISLSDIVFEKNHVVRTLVLLSGALFHLLGAAGQHDFMWISVPGYHIGATLMAIVSLAVVARVVQASVLPRKHAGLWLYGLVFCLSFLVSASDLLYIVQFSFPCMGALLCLYFLSLLPLRQTVLVAGSILASIPTSLLVYSLLPYQSAFQFMHVSQAGVGQATLNLLTFLVEFRRLHPLTALIWLSFVGISIMILVALFTNARNLKREADSVFALFVSFVVISIVTNVTTTVLVNWIADRYFIFAIIVPACFGWPFLLARSRKLLHLIENRIGYYALVLGVLLVSHQGLASLKHVTALPNLSDYYPKFIKCLDEETQKRHLQNGLAHYWQARYITMLSKHNLSVVQIQAQDLGPMHWTNDIHDYYRNDYEFIVLDRRPADAQYRIDPEIVLKRFGPPANSFDCESSTVWVYDRDGDVLFREIFQGHPRLASFDQRGNRYEYRNVSMGHGHRD